MAVDSVATAMPYDIGKMAEAVIDAGVHGYRRIHKKISYGR